MTPLRRGGGPLVLAALLALGGCSGTSFGRRLAGSFDPPVASPSAPPTPGAPQQAPNGSSGAGPQAAPTAQPAAAAKPDTAKLDTPVKPGTAAVAPTATKAPSTKNSTAGTALAAKVSPGKAMVPVPYRVTIKLPTADPSAPAEAVTEALRAAGISFEVETIERIRNGMVPAPAAAPQATPAPAPR